VCRTEIPTLRALEPGSAHRTACHFAEELVGVPSPVAVASEDAR
jgi:hypothetical protein